MEADSFPPLSIGPLLGIQSAWTTKRRQAFEKKCLNSEYRPWPSTLTFSFLSFRPLFNPRKGRGLKPHPRLKFSAINGEDVSFNPDPRHIEHRSSAVHNRTGRAKKERGDYVLIKLKKLISKQPSGAKSCLCHFQIKYIFTLEGAQNAVRQYCTRSVKTKEENQRK